MENYDSNELIDYLNNPIKKGLWSLSATVDDEEEINTLIENKRITENQKVMREFQLSFSEAFDLKPEGSIRSSGLAMELLLEEIYESLFRDKAPSKTLGNLFNILNGKVNEIIDGDNNNSTDEKCEDIFKDINCIIKQESNPNLLKVIEISSIILHKTKEMEKKINIVDKKFQLKQEKSSLLFSESITENINKTIELRNLSSHRTMNELTTFQAALALRGTFNLLSWWNYQNTSFSDWDKSIEEVVKSVVKQSENFKL